MKGSFSVTQQLVLNVRVEGDMLTVWVDGYDAVLTVSLAEHCEKGTVSLVARKYDGDGGGIKSFTIQEKSKISEINSKLNINTDILANENFTLLRKRLIRY